MEEIHQQESQQYQKHSPKNHSAAVSRLIRLPEVMNRVSLSRTAIYNRLKAGTFPKPVKLGSRAIAWQESSIDDWIADRIMLSQVEEVQS